MALSLLAGVLAMAGIVPGTYVGKLPAAARFLVLFSGVLLVAVALFALLPELAREIGWARGLPVFSAGYLLLFVIDRKTQLVCPACSDHHGHNHLDCEAALHGFTVPLVLAAAAHAFLDGWGLSSVHTAEATGVKMAFPIAILLHKVPEGLALGAILKAATRTRMHAVLWGTAAESATIAGAFAGLALTPHLGNAWTNYPLALAGGAFLYLGYHALHIGWTRATTIVSVP